MRSLMKHVLLLGNQGGAVSLLPLDVDFTALSDGPLPEQFVGATWAIASGVATNTPTLGAEKLTDPGLEAAYTDGKCNTLTKSGNPTLIEETSDVHGGSKAQKFTAAANGDRLNYPQLTALPAGWYDARVWSKRAAGTGGSPRIQLDQLSGGADETVLHLSTSYAERGLVARLDTLNTFFFPIRENGSSGFDTVLVDDGSLKQITQAEMMSLLPATSADIVIKAKFNTHFVGTSGIVIRANAQTNPTSFIALWMFRYDNAIIKFFLHECVAGAWNILFNSISATGIDENKWIEIRAAGNDISVFYGEVQVSTTKAANAALAGNNFHGLFGSQGVGCTRFFCIPSLTEVAFQFTGGSITEDLTGYSYRTRDWLISTYPQNHYTVSNSAISGQNSWANLVRYPADIEPNTPDYVIFDPVNDDDVPNDPPALEALIRRVWTDTPNARLIAMQFFGVTDYTDDATLTASPHMINWNANIGPLLAHYDIPFVAYYDAIVAAVAGGAHLTDYFRDNIHPNDGGRALSASLLQAALVAGAPVHLSGSLPARLHAESEAYEYAPTRLLGTDYDSRSGTWADNGTATSTSENGATITYSGTCTSFGCPSASKFMDVSINGGDFTSMFLSSNGVQIPSGRGAYTITLRNPAATALNITEFWMV